MKKIIPFVIAVVLACSTSLKAQQAQAFFSASSPTDAADKNYGVVNISAGTHTVVIGTIMAYGENVKDLNIRMENGFVFKLAPAQAGMNLNYIGNSMNIVLRPFEKATISFTSVPKGVAVKQLYVSWQEINN